MIKKSGKTIESIIALGRTVAYVYKGARLVWEAIRSCFGSGRWINEKPWRNDDRWKN